MKYELIEWPESQEFVGHPDCYLVNSLCWNTEQYSQAYFVPENIILELKTHNNSMFNIETMFEQYNYYNILLRESMRNYISEKLINISKNNPIIKLIDSVEYQLWLDKNVIYFKYNSEIIKFDQMLVENLLKICKSLK
jgi:hypothetical protein